MTNEQLAVLLDGIQQELDTAIAATRALLAASRPRQHGQRHVPPGLCFNLLCENPEHFREVEWDDPIDELSPIDEVSTEIGGRIDMLREASRGQAHT